jgi:hypothetical protein
MKMPQPAPAPMDSSNEITINADGTFSPATGAVINPGGVVKFDVTYPAGMNTCTITFGAITFSYVAGATETGNNTIKVG